MVNEKLESMLSDYKAEYMTAIEQAYCLFLEVVKKEIYGNWSVVDNSITVTIDREKNEVWQKMALLLQPYLPGWAKKSTAVSGQKHWEETFAAYLEQQGIQVSFDNHNKEVYLKYTLEEKENQ